MRCVCCAFRKVPPETFSPGVFFFVFKDPHPTFELLYSRGDGDGDGDRFPLKIYILPRGELREYYGSTW